MKKYFAAAFILLLTIVSINCAQGKNRSFAQFPDGAQIGPDVNGRLPFLDCDEYADNSGLGSMTALETRVITFEGMTNQRPGASLGVHPANPLLYNQPSLLISHVWVPEDGVVQVVVKNMVNATVDYGSDQWVIGGCNTVNSKDLKRTNGVFTRPMRQN